VTFAESFARCAALTWGVDLVGSAPPAHTNWASVQPASADLKTDPVSKNALSAQMSGEKRVIFSSLAVVLEIVWQDGKFVNSNKTDNPPLKY